MKRIICILAVLMLAAPAMGMTIWLEQADEVNDPERITVRYDASGDANLPRAFGLNITVDNDCNIGSVDPCTGAGFNIHPWSITITGDPPEIYMEDGFPSGSAVNSDDVNYAGMVLGGENTPGATIEMASLYVGAANEPNDYGVLLRFDVRNDCNYPKGDCFGCGGILDATVTITENTFLGGVVMEDPQLGTGLSNPIDTLFVTFSTDWDCDPPTPDPLTWAALPDSIDCNEISLAATVATDLVHDVEYYYECTTNGDFNVGWTASTTVDVNNGDVNDPNLVDGVEYCFKVKARDTSENNDSEWANETEWSDIECVTNMCGESDPPTPDPMTWATLPEKVDCNEFLMVATTATDASPPVEYLFECTTDNSLSSGWQLSSTYTLDATGIADANTVYLFRVKAKDASGNETGWSDANYWANCCCGGDITGSFGFGPPDGWVDTGDISRITTLMLTIPALPGTFWTYPIPDPWPADIHCFDITGSFGFGAHDRVIDTGDISSITTQMLTIPALPGPFWTYPIPCQPVQ